MFTKEEMLDRYVKPLARHKYKHLQKGQRRWLCRQYSLTDSLTCRGSLLCHSPQFKLPRHGAVPWQDWHEQVRALYAGGSRRE